MTYLLGIITLVVLLALSALGYIATVRQSNRLFAAGHANPGNLPSKPAGRRGL